MPAKEYIGFGYEPAECAQHFSVYIPRKKESFVSVFECFSADDDVLDSMGKSTSKLKVSLSREKWDLVRPAIEENLNKTLKSTDRKSGRFVIGVTKVERLLGKEIMVLLWAIEDCDKSVIPDAIRNWNGLSREERWWLFTMTNAATGDADYKRGWRIALRYAITENPVIEKKAQLGLFDGIFSN